ncbi:MAG: leucine-rich repeat domain-containing protein, partial [Rikenellaceae bacterium]|nr:leucine-rich repeat domain-containing protein [Rikenellaceae bacterium]
FDGLLSNNDYTVRVTYTYDLNDGTGAHTIVKDLTVKTLAKATPSLALAQTDRSQTDFAFDITVTDIDAVGAITTIELLHGNDAPVPAANLDVRSFDGLLSNNDYTVRVTYTYDLNDGTGAHTIVKELTVKTLAKATPSVTLTQTDLTQTGFAFDLALSDLDNLATITALEWCHGNDEYVACENLDVRAFEGLLSNNEYTVRVTYTYDLCDGVGLQIATKELAIKTQKKQTPVVTLSNLTVNEYTISFDVLKTDPDEVGEITGVALYNRAGDALIAESDTLDSALFEELAPNEHYTIIISYAYDLNDGNGRIETAMDETVKTKSVVTIEGVTYQLYDDRTATVIAIAEGVTTPVFRCTEGYTITKIHDSACKNHPRLKTVVLPEGVIEIGKQAFSNCEKLQSVSLPSTLQSINDYAFYWCTNLSNITLPNGLLYIGDWVFTYDNIRQIIIPESVSTIGAYAFSYPINILCKASSKPSGWYSEWSDKKAFVVWNFKELYTDEQGLTYALCNDGTAAVIDRTETLPANVV